MSNYVAAIRQGWACGYETAREGAVAWTGLGYNGPPTTVCPGYSTSLPETIEIARAWKWWSKGQLEVFVDRRPVSDKLKLGLELFDGEVNAFDRWRLTPREKGGGAD